MIGMPEVTLKMPPPLASAFTALGILILISLGVWQLQRLEWKTELLANITHENTKNARTVSLSFKDISGPAESNFYKRGTVKGSFLLDREILLGPKSADGKFVNYVVTPMQIDGGGYVLVQRGWVPENFEALQINGSLAQLPDQWVTGFIQKPQFNMFMPENNPEDGFWFRLDVREIGSYLDLSPLSPYVLYAEDASYAQQEWPKIGYFKKPRLRNNHAGYATFWFAMATALAIVYSLKFVVRFNE